MCADSRLDRKRNQVVLPDTPSPRLSEKDCQLARLKENIQDLEKKNGALRQQNRRLRKEVRDLLTIGQAARSITSSLKVQEILRNVLTGIKEVLGMDKVLLCLVNGEKRIEEVKVAVGIDPVELTNASWRVPEGDPIWKALSERKMPILVRRSKDKEALPPFVRQIFPHHFVKAPIVVNTQIVGTIMGSRTKPQPSKRDLKLLGTFAEYTAVAIQNGRLHYDVIKSEEKLRKTQNQLVQTERMAVIGQVAISINHEINNPLSNINLIAQMVQKDLQHREPQLAARLEQVGANVKRIQEVASKISELKSATTTEYLPNQSMISLK